MERADTKVYRVPILTGGGDEEFRIVGYEQLREQLKPIDYLFFRAFIDTSASGTDDALLPQIIPAVGWVCWCDELHGIKLPDAGLCSTWLMHRYMHAGIDYSAGTPNYPGVQRGTQGRGLILAADLEQTLLATYRPRVLATVREHWLRDMRALAAHLRKIFGSAPPPDPKPERTRRPNLLERRGLLATPPDFRDIFGLEPS